MNVLNIISSTLTKQHSTYFQRGRGPAPEDSRSPRTTAVRSSGGNKINARQFNSINTSILLDSIQSSLPNPDWEVVTRFSNCLFSSLDVSSKGSTKVLYTALALKEWLLAKGHLNDNNTRRQEVLTLARGHLEMWLMTGIAAEIYHLKRSKELYADYFTSFPEFSTAKDQVDRCKVLLFLGEWADAAEIITQVIASSTGDPQMTNYCFYAGVIFKSLGDYDRASEFFFEATQSGPPRYFSQIEMMTIISRNLEEMNADGEGEDNEDAYRMVHAHLVMEGLIHEDTDYEDWIFDANTWLALGDKCAMHHMYSLATDFYGLGIMKDPDAFRKPMLWLRFAKSCKRCGRKADAQLAVKQALSRDPFNTQLIRAFQYCNEPEETRFPALIRGDLADILAILPPEESTGAVVVSKLQAIVKGALERTGLLLGVGANKANTRPMVAKVGVLLHGMPLLIKVHANWMGKVAHLKVYDVAKDKVYKVKLRTPFTPTRETGAPRKLELTLQLLKLPKSEHQRRGGSGKEDQHATELVLKFTDHDSGHYSYRRMRLDLLVPRDPSGAFDDRTRPALEVQLEDLSMAEHRSILALPEQPSLYNTLLQESMLAMHGSAEATLTVSDLPSASGSLPDANTADSRRLGTTRAGLYTSVEEEVFSVISITNALTVELVKEAFQHRGRYYLARVVNEHDVTQVTIMQLHSDRLFVFLMAREHIDRAHSLAKRWVLLMNILEQNPATAPMVLSGGAAAALLSENFSQLSGPSELYGGSQRSQREQQRVENPLELSSVELQQATAALHAPQTILGIRVYTSMLPRGNGVSLILVSPHNQPIIGTGLEVVDNTDPTPTSISLLRDTVSHRFRSDQFASNDSLDRDREGDEGRQVVRDHSRSQQDQDFGERLGFEDDGSFDFDYVPVTEAGESERVRGEDSAYELLGGAAAVRRSGQGDQFALSPEEYALMVQSQEDGLLTKTDSDMIGLRFGGALDDDSVSQIMWGNASDPQMVRSTSVSPMSPHRANPVLAESPRAADAQADVPGTFPENAFQKEAMKDLAETMDFITNVADQKEQVPAFTLQPVAPVPAVPAAAAESRITAARKSISLGMNLGAALTAALTSGDKPAGAPAHPAKKSKPPVAHRHKETPVQEPAATHRRRSSVSKYREAVQALIKVKSTALAVTSIVVGSALISATAQLAGERADELRMDAVPAPFVPSLSFALDAIGEGDEDDRESEASHSQRPALTAVEEGAKSSSARSAAGSAQDSTEDDWIARLFREADFPDSADVSVHGAGTGIAELGADGAEGAEGADIADSDQDELSDEEQDLEGEGVADDVPAVEAQQVDIEWIVELGSSGAVEAVEDTVLEELLDEGATFWSEVYSDQIPPLREPIVEAALGEALQSVVEFNVHTASLATEMLEREIGFQSACVTLVQMLESVAMQGASKKIIAANKLKAQELKKQAQEEKARAAAAAAEESARLAAASASAKAIALLTPTKPSLATSSTSPSSVSPERTPYRPRAMTETEELAAAEETKSGYFVKKIRSQMNGVSVSAGAVSGMSGLRSQSVGQIPAGFRRLESMRDTFTPELPPTLQDPSVQRPHTHHVQLTANKGGVSLTSAPGPVERKHSALLSGGIDQAGDTILAQSGVPLHITNNSEERDVPTWEGNDPSLDKYFQLKSGQAPSFTESQMTPHSIPGRSAAHVSKHNRQVNHSRRAQNRNKPAEEAAPLWLQLGGAGSASFLLPEGSTLLETNTALNASASLDLQNSLAHFPGGTAPLPLPLPTTREIPSGDVPIVSMLYARAQSPAMPAAGLPDYAFDSAEGLKNALQNNWDGRTIPRYWGTALKQRADERINEPFAVKSAHARKQRRAIKAKTAFAAAAAAAAVNSTSLTREETDRQFTKLLDENEMLHETFFESHLDPYGGTDGPYPDHMRRSQSQAQDLTATYAGPVAALNRVSTAPAHAMRALGVSMSSFESLTTAGDAHPPNAQSTAQPTAQPKAHQRPASGSRLAGPDMVRFTIPSAPAPIVHTTKTFKGLTHNHDYDDSNLLSNQVEPPFHNINTRIACRSPPDMALHFKRSTAAIAEEIDEAVEREEVDGMFRQSLEIFHKVGYVQKRPLPHATHWIKVVSLYLTSLKSIDELRKRLATLTRASPRSLTTEEAICVLSDTKGIVGQAIEKLKHLEYYAEIKLVCRSIHIKSMVHLLQGGDDVYKFKVGDGRSRTASQEQSMLDGTENYIDTRPGGAMFHGMDEDMFRAATMVVDPYSAEMVEQHHEVVAHRKIREHYDEFNASNNIKPQRAQSARMPSSKSMLSGTEGEAGEERRPTTGFAEPSISSPQMSKSGAADSTASAAKEATNLGLFLPSVQPVLHKDSPFVRSRANMVTLSGSISVAPNAMDGVDVNSLGEGSSVSAVGKNHPRNSLRMSVTAPKKSSMMVPNNRNSVAGSFSSTSNRLLGAIAAAVAAADSAEEREDRSSADEQSPTARMPQRIGSMKINTGGGGSTRSSFKVTPSHAQKEWRKNSGIFEAGTPRSSNAGSQHSSREGSPKHARGSSRKSKNGIVSFSTRSNGSASSTPKWQQEQQRVFFTEEEEDEEEAGDEGEGAIQETEEDGGEDGGDEEVQDEEEEVVVEQHHPWGSKISINPWYLSHQQVSPPAHPKVVKLAHTKQPVKQKSYRAANIVQDIFNQEAVGVPFAVMSRRDAERATKDETLSRSDKQYIRKSIEVRASKYQHV